MGVLPKLSSLQMTQMEEMKEEKVEKVEQNSHQIMKYICSLKFTDYTAL